MKWIQTLYRDKLYVINAFILVTIFLVLCYNYFVDNIDRDVNELVEIKSEIEQIKKQSLQGYDSDKLSQELIEYERRFEHLLRNQRSKYLAQGRIGEFDSLLVNNMYNINQ